MPRHPRAIRFTPILLVALVTGWESSTTAADRAEPSRMVLVELYTSQGCNMCPEAEEILGKLASRDRRIVPIAFHVDYFNNPWKDVFSDPLHSQRQAVYNRVYTKPKPAEYGLYYTPMLMIDGEQSVNGRDPDSAAAAIRGALARKPEVSIDVELTLDSDALSGKAKVKVTGLSPRASRSSLLLCAVLREDGVVTEIPSGENAGKSLVARYPARQTKFEFIEMKNGDPTDRNFSFTADPSWNRENLWLAVFAQDRRTAIVYQSSDLPWRSNSPAVDRSPNRPRKESRPVR